MRTRTYYIQNLFDEEKLYFYPYKRLKNKNFYGFMMYSFRPKIIKTSVYNVSLWQEITDFNIIPKKFIDFLRNNGL